MTIASTLQPPRPSDFSTGLERTTLRSISEPAISFAIWRRSLAPHAVAALAAWIEHAALEIDLVLAADEPLRAAAPALAQLPADSAVAEDVEQLLADFRGISAARKVRVVLGVRRTDSCRKFHADFVHLRLITTYFGPGTEWVPDYAVDRAVLADPPAAPREANRKIVRDARALRRANAGDVLLLKGERAAGARAAVHRSPPIAARGLTRLVLTLTTAD